MFKSSFLLGVVKSKPTIKIVTQSNVKERHGGMMPCDPQAPMYIVYLI